ncbi:MAG: restriction endonuclease subunit S [Bacteroidales bacterium]|nr:restriction endonuclease subunit S [Bacteroidales bacterium]
MIAERLRKSILQAAIHGQLTEQLPEDGDARDLLAEIQAAKAQLIKDGKIKQEKALPAIAEDEIPFNIPENWCWVRLNDICQQIGDIDHKMPQTVTNGIPYISPVDFYGENGINFDTAKQISYEDYLRLSAKIKHGKNDIVFPRYGTIGVLRYIEIDREFLVSYSCATIKSFVTLNNPMFLYYCLQSPHIKDEIVRYINKTTQPNVGLASIKQFLIPFPPKLEQDRIVTNLNGIINDLLLLAKDENKLKVLQKSFPKKMKDSLLQSAIQGKLTEQLQSDGDAHDLVEKIQKEKARLIEEKKIKKEKDIPEITEDEIPFNIPDNWCWVRLGDCLDVRDGTHDTPKYVSQGVPLVTSKNLNNGRLDFSTAKFISEKDSKIINSRSSVDDGDILFAMIGSIGNPALVKKDREFSIKNVALFKNINQIMNMQYAYYYLSIEQKTMKKISSGGVQTFVSLSFLRKYLIPLPPLAEQHRIVERLDQLLPLCDALE